MSDAHTAAMEAEFWEGMLTPEEVAKNLHVSSRFIRDEAASGALDGVRFGRKWCFTRAAVARYVAARASAQEARVLTLAQLQKP